MNFINLLFLALIAYGLWRIRRSVRSAGSARERALIIRGAAATWLFGFLLIVAFLYLPNKARVLMMVPVFLLSVGLARAWRNVRDRLRGEEQIRGDFEKMKRVN